MSSHSMSGFANGFAASPTPSAGDDPSPPRHGYDWLARAMGDIPQVAIFQRFADLSAENLLHMQAEMMELKARLRGLQAQEAAFIGDDKERFTMNSLKMRDAWEKAAEARSSGVQATDNTWKENIGAEQWDTIMEIRVKIKEYHEALALHRQMVDLPTPREAHLEAIRTWMDRPRLGNIVLGGDDRKIWRTHNLDELVSMEPTAVDGMVSSSSAMWFVRMYHLLIGRHVHKTEPPQSHLRNTVFYRDHGVVRFIRGTLTLVACMLPVLGIIVLHTYKDTNGRLGVIAAATFVFAFFLNIFTSAGIKDIFSATAAFSAVMVVFVGTTIDP